MASGVRLLMGVDVLEAMPWPQVCRVLMCWKQCHGHRCQAVDGCYICLRIVIMWTGSRYKRWLCEHSWRRVHYSIIYATLTQTMLERSVSGSSSKAQFIETASLLVTTIATFVTNGLAASKQATSFGFKNTTAAISDMFYSQITPAGFTFIIRGFVYTWQVMWLVYAWSFDCRPRAVRTIYVGAYWTYTLANLCNITWIYLWGNEFVKDKASLQVISLFDLSKFLYSTVLLMWIYFYIDTLRPYEIPLR